MLRTILVLSIQCKLKISAIVFGAPDGPNIFISVPLRDGDAPHYVRIEPIQQS
jgi:hypothetical protein